MSPEIVAPPSRVSVSLSRDEIKLLKWLVEAVQRGSRDSEIQATVCRKHEWGALRAKIMRLRDVTTKPQNVDNGD